MSDDGNPSKQLSKEVREELVHKMNERRKDALDDAHTLILNHTWKTQKEVWHLADDDTRRSMIYGLVMHDGGARSGVKVIAKFFAIKPKDLDPYMDVFDMAEAAMEFKVQRNQISNALSRDDQPNMKFWLGKQFARQVNDPAHEGVEAVSAGAPTIVMQEVKADNKELRDELESAVQTAIALAGAKTKQAH